MKIEDNRSSKVEFKYLDVGDVFIDGGERLAIKIPSLCNPCGYYYNAINLCNGDAIRYDDDDTVEPTDATLVLN